MDKILAGANTEMCTLKWVAAVTIPKSMRHWHRDEVVCGEEIDIRGVKVEIHIKLWQHLIKLYL